MQAFLVLASIFQIHALNEVLHNTQENHFKDWQTTKQTGRSKLGWQLQQKNGKTFYKVCDATDLHGHSENTLISPKFPISIEGDSPHLLQLSLKYKIHPCGNKCRDNGKLTIGVYQNSYDERPIFKGDSLNISNTIGILRIDASIVADKLKSQHFYIGIKESGACVDIKSVKLTARYCPAKNAELMYLPRTYVSSTFSMVKASCVKGASINNSEKSTSKGICNDDGEWMEDFESLCECDYGYQPHSDYTKCIECKIGYYKETQGNYPCKRCPKHSGTSDQGQRKCACNPGFFIEKDAAIGTQCAHPPSEPRNLTSRSSSRSIYISWQRPSNLGGRDQVWYSVIVWKHSILVKKKSIVYALDTRINDLKPNTNYTITVSSHNTITDQTTSESASLRAKTKPHERIQGIQVKREDPQTIELNWKHNPGHLSSKTNYVIRMYTGQKNSNTRAVYNVNGPPFRQSGLFPNVYYFEVGIGSNEKDAVFSEAVSIELEPVNPFQVAQIQQLCITIGFIFAVIMLLMAVCVAALCCYRKKDELPWIKSRELIEVTPQIDFPIKAVQNQAFLEPMMIEESEKILNNFTREIDENYLEQSYDSLKGRYYDSAKGYLRVNNDEKLTVALTHIGEDAGFFQKRHFIVAAGICGQFNHPNVQMLHGIIRKGCNQLTMVLEYAEKGPLDLLLLENPSSFSTLQMVHMARGVACGMHYLSDEGYIHKVLKGSNILVSKNLVCKISGFDKRAALEDNKNKIIQIPEDLVAWTAPEIYIFNQFSWSSDVWSFGMLLWQFMALGESPFAEYTPDETVKMIEGGYRLPPPSACPQCIYDLILECGLSDPNGRPLFSQIREFLENIIRNPQLIHTRDLKVHGKNRKSYLSQPSPKTIPEWLEGLGLCQYDSLFKSAGLYTLEDIVCFDNEYLKMLGVTHSKHRKKMVKSIDRLKSRSLALGFSLT